MEIKKTLLERLKESGIGTVLYSPALGKLSLIGIDESKTRPIITGWGGKTFYFTKDGKLVADREAPVMLFFEGEHDGCAPTAEEREEIEEGTVVMFSDNSVTWRCGKYMGHGRATTCGFGIYDARYIVPVEEFKPTGPYWFPDSKYDYGQKPIPI